jgi:hypothetical protein
MSYASLFIGVVAVIYPVVSSLYRKAQAQAVAAVTASRWRRTSKPPHRSTP